MIQFRKAITAVLVTAVLFSSCKKDDPIIPNEEEVITTLRYTLTPTDGSEAIVLSFQDLDGDGGNAPIITGGTLDSDKTYTGSLVLLNEQESPAEDITEEVEEEGDEHQFFFQTDIAGLAVAYNDTDADGNPIGIQSTLTTTGIGAGTLTIVLRHEPNKSASGVAAGDITNAGGETDIEVTFNITVE